MNLAVSFRISSGFVTHLFQQSYDQGETPAIWRNANVAPVFKKGPVCNAANYRPISLTCIACKVMEHVVVSHMRKHLELHNALTELQHGFRAKHSCDTQLLLTVHDLMEQMDRPKTQIDICVLDFSKAFDVVPHRRLMSKLRLYGIDGKCANWIWSFLADRTQQVVVDGVASPTSPVTSGVPQGTILGPLLFLIFINDIVCNIDPGTQMRLFADDCLVYRRIASIQDQIQLQRDLDALTAWGNQWGMRFNASKCNVLVVTNLQTPIPKFYQLNNQVLKHVEAAQYLGIILQSNLKFNSHIQEITSRANSRLGFLKRNLKGVDSALKRTAYVSLVRSGLESASAIWDTSIGVQQRKIELVQNRAMRWIRGLPPFDRTSIKQLLEDTSLDTLENRRREARLSLMWKVTHDHVAVTPEQLGLSPPDWRTRTGVTGHAHRYKEIKARKERLKNSFVGRTVPEWNRLPAAVAEAVTYDSDQGSFKSQLAEARRR